MNLRDWMSLHVKAQAARLVGAVGVEDRGTVGGEVQIVLGEGDVADVARTTAAAVALDAAANRRVGAADTERSTDAQHVGAAFVVQEARNVALAHMHVRWRGELVTMSRGGKRAYWVRD